MGLIAYANKVIGDLWTAANANEIKSVVNANATDNLAVTTTGSTITLNLDSKGSRIFNGSTSFAVDKTIALSNATNGQTFIFNFQTTAALELTFPSNFRSSDTRFAALKLDLPMPGYYDISATYDAVNSIWKLRACEDGGVV